MERAKCVCENEASDLVSLSDSIFNGRSKMNSGINA
jgi:hypothetical protein